MPSMPNISLLTDVSSRGGHSLLSFPPTVPDAIPPDADRLRAKSAPFWYENQTGKRGDRITWWLPRDQVGAFLMYVGGKPQSIMTSWGGAVLRIVPMQNPDDLGQYAFRAEVDWGGNSFDEDQYSSAKVTVDFKTPDYEIAGPTPYASLKMAASHEGISIPGCYLIAESTSEALGKDSYIAIPSVTYIITLYKATQVNYGAIESAMIAPVNSTTLYLPNGIQVAPGYALFSTVEDDIQVFLGGVPSRTVSYRIRFRKYLTWQQILHKGIPTRVLQQNGNLLYATSDLNSLFL